MKANLFLQLVLSVLLTVLSSVMAATAFARDSALLWKVATVLLVAVFFNLTKHIRKELKQ
jgi:hypothetical protein